MVLKLYNSVEKELKITARSFWGLTYTIGEVTREKLLGAGGGGIFYPSSFLGRFKYFSI